MKPKILKFYFDHKYGLLIMAGIIMSFVMMNSAHAQSELGIIALVNDEPISAYDVDQRMKLKLLGSPQITKRLKEKVRDPQTSERFRAMAMKAKPTSQEEVNALKEKFFRQLRNEVVGSLKSGLKKQVMEELIDERLMLQEAKKLNVVASKAEVDKQLQTMASRSKDRSTGKPLTLKQFIGQIKRSGVSESAFRNRMKANISFQKIVQRKYGRFISVGDQEVDRLLANTPGAAGETKIEYQLQRVVLKLPKDAEQKDIASRFLEADKLRTRFSSCKNTKTLTQGMSNASVQLLGKRTSAQIPQPARTMLLQAQAGEMTAPSFTVNAIELYAVCNRRTVTSDQKERQKVKNTLRQKEYEIVRRRYMRDLRQDAFVEYRQQ